MACNYGLGYSVQWRTDEEAGFWVVLSVDWDSLYLPRPQRLANLGCGDEWWRTRDRKQLFNKSSRVSVYNRVVWPLWVLLYRTEFSTPTLGWVGEWVGGRVSE